MSDVQKSPMNLLKDALKFGGFREETFECENANGERRLVPPFITSLVAGNLSLTIEFGDEVKGKSTARRITYDILVKNMYPDEYELAYEDSADYADCAATEISKAIMLRTKRESTVHHERVFKRLSKDVEKNVKDETKQKEALDRKKTIFDERMEAVNRNRFPTWEELDTVEDPEKVWYNRMMKASRAYNLDIDWDFEFDYSDKEDKKVTCAVQVHQKKEGEEEPTFLFKLDHSAELGSGKDEESGRFKTKGDFVRQIKGQLSEDIVNQLVTEGIMEDAESAMAVLKERSDAALEARLNETEEEREARIAKLKEERKKNPKKDDKKKTMRQKLKEKRDAAKNAKDTEKTKKKALDEKIAAKKEKLKAKAKAKRDAKKGKKPAADDEAADKKPARKQAPKKDDAAPGPRKQKTKAELRKFYLDTVKKVTANEKLDADKKKKLCEKYKKIYEAKVDALKDQKPAGRPSRPAREEKREAPSRGARRDDTRRGGDRKDTRDSGRRNERDSRGPKRGRDDNDFRGGRGAKQAHYGQPVYAQPVMMTPQMYAPPPNQSAYQPQPVQQRNDPMDALRAMQAQHAAQMQQLQSQLQSFTQQPAQRQSAHPTRPSNRRW